MTDTLTPDVLRVRDGTWSGLLFENQSFGYGPALSWAFHVDFADITSPDGTTITPSLTVDWVPLAAQSWSQVAPATVLCERFAEPVESSVYYFEHCRFDTVRLDLFDQEGSHLHARLAIQGDIDDLGIDGLTVEAPMTFTGIGIALDSIDSLSAARKALQTFTDICTLEGRQEGSHYVFVPTGH